MDTYFRSCLLLGILAYFGFTYTNSILINGETLNSDLPHMSDTCLGCICEATSNCNLTIGCTRGLCGPFLISKYYWFMAKRPVLRGDDPNRSGAYGACVNDPYCAAQTVQQYLERYAQDCNRDTEIDCDDYARMHYLGGEQCTLSMDKYRYYTVFRNCMDASSKLNG